MATIEARIRFQTENEQQAERAFKSLSSSQRDLIQAFELGNRKYDDVQQELRATATSAEQLETALQSLQRAQQNLNRTELNTQRFDVTSRKVALAGDFQSNLGAGQALLQSAGAGNVAQSIGITGEIVVLLEELPRLKEALRGLPDVAQAAVTALGPVGLGVIAGLTALAVVAVKVGKDLSAAGNEVGAQFASDLEIQLAAVNGLTKEGAEERLAILKAEQEVLKEAIKQGEADRAALAEEGSEILKQTLKNIFDATVTVFQKIGEAIRTIIFNALQAVVTGDTSKITEGLNTIGDDILDAIVEPFVTKGINKELKSAEDQLDKTSRSIESLEKALADGVFESEKLSDSITELGQSAAAAAASSGLSAQEQKDIIAERRVSAGFSVAGIRNPLVLSSNPLSIGGVGKAAVQAAQKTNEDLKNKYEERERIARDFNKREAEIRKQALFDAQQEQAQFEFDQRRLARSGSFGAFFEAAENQQFSNKQTSERLQFEASQRLADVNEQLSQVANDLANAVVNVQVQTNPQLATATATSNTSRVLSFGRAR